MASTSAPACGGYGRPCGQPQACGRGVSQTHSGRWFDADFEGLRECTLAWPRTRTYRPPKSSLRPPLTRSAALRSLTAPPRQARSRRCAVPSGSTSTDAPAQTEERSKSARRRARCFLSLGGSSFAALQAFEQPDRFWRPHLLCHLVPGPRLRGIRGKTSDAKRIKNIRIICRPSRRPGRLRCRRRR
jgi:hypothetical protein